jgi:hypothetical protein
MATRTASRPRAPELSPTDEAALLAVAAPGAARRSKSVSSSSTWPNRASMARLVVLGGAGGVIGLLTNLFVDEVLYRGPARVPAGGAGIGPHSFVAGIFFTLLVAGLLTAVAGYGLESGGKAFWVEVRAYPKSVRPLLSHGLRNVARGGLWGATAGLVVSLALTPAISWLFAGAALLMLGPSVRLATGQVIALAIKRLGLLLGTRCRHRQGLVLLSAVGVLGSAVGFVFSALVSSVLVRLIVAAVLATGPIALGGRRPRRKSAAPAVSAAHCLLLVVGLATFAGPFAGSHTASSTTTTTTTTVAHRGARPPKATTTTRAVPSSTTTTRPSGGGAPATTEAPVTATTATAPVASTANQAPATSTSVSSTTSATTAPATSTPATTAPTTSTPPTTAPQTAPTSSPPTTFPPPAPETTTPPGTHVVQDSASLVWVTFHDKQGYCEILGLLRFPVVPGAVSYTGTIHDSGTPGNGPDGPYPPMTLTSSGPPFFDRTTGGARKVFGGVFDTPPGTHQLGMTNVGLNAMGGPVPNPTVCAKWYSYHRGEFSDPRVVALVAGPPGSLPGAQTSDGLSGPLAGGSGLGLLAGFGGGAAGTAAGRRRRSPNSLNAQLAQWRAENPYAPWSLCPYITDPNTTAGPNVGSLFLQQLLAHSSPLQLGQTGLGLLVGLGQGLLSGGKGLYNFATDTALSLLPGTPEFNSKVQAVQAALNYLANTPVSQMGNDFMGGFDHKVAGQMQAWAQQYVTAVNSGDDAKASQMIGEFTGNAQFQLALMALTEGAASESGAASEADAATSTADAVGPASGMPPNPVTPPDPLADLPQPTAATAPGPPPLSPEQLQAVQATAGPLPNGVSFISSSTDQLGNWWSSLGISADPDGAFTVLCHGGPNAALIGDEALNASDMATLVRQSGWVPGEPIRLLSCWTGSDAGGFAQALANELGVPVTAPNGLCVTGADGSVSSLVKTTRLVNGQTVTTYRAGSFMTFLPAGQ